MLHHLAADRDTRAALTAVKAPVLLLQGCQDMQVLKADYDAKWVDARR